MAVCSRCGAEIPRDAHFCARCGAPVADPCGHHLEGADDGELFRLAREHVDRDHPEMQRTDEQLRERVAADAYDLTPTTSKGG